jgi:hypothetical protein
MAVALPRNTGHAATRPHWMRQQTSESSSLLALLMLALLVVGIMTVLLSAQALPTITLGNLRALTQKAVPVRPAEGVVPSEQAAILQMADSAAAAPVAAAPATQPATVTAAPEPVANAVVPAGDSIPATTAFAVGQRAKIAHTDGQGVVLHSRPDQDARQPAGLLEGRPVIILELSGADWARVQSDAKQAGWVSTQYLVAE